jgi:phospholipid/cholesterol/gamma-HCH transport system permease protein
VVATPSAPLVPIARGLGRVGRGLFHVMGAAGRMVLFLRAILVRVVRRPYRPHEIGHEIELIGARSVGVVALSAIFTGLVLALQGHNVLVRFGSEELVGSLVTLSLTRELAPVLTALMVTARAGSAMAATIGTMAVTEQLDALKAMAVDPVQYLAVPRLIASIVAVPLLTALFSLVGVAASYLFAVSVLGLDGPSFMSNVRSSVEGADVSIGLWKALMFGVLIAWVATFNGFAAAGGARGVGSATSRTVVHTAVLVLCGDYVATALLS